MNAFLKVIIVVAIAAIGFFLVQLYKDRFPRLENNGGWTEQWARLINAFSGKEQEPDESVPPPPPPPSPAEIVAKLDGQIHTLRMELVGELMNFQSSYDYRTGGWSGPSNAGSRASYSTSAPETADFIGRTTNPKLKRARELQRQIGLLQVEASQQRARMQ